MVIGITALKQAPTREVKQTAHTSNSMMSSSVLSPAMVQSCCLYSRGLLVRFTYTLPTYLEAGGPQDKAREQTHQGLRLGKEQHNSRPLMVPLNLKLPLPFLYEWLAMLCLWIAVGAMAPGPFGCPNQLGLPVVPILPVLSASMHRKTTERLAGYQGSGSRMF